MAAADSLQRGTRRKRNPLEEDSAESLEGEQGPRQKRRGKRTSKGDQDMDDLVEEFGERVLDDLKALMQCPICLGVIRKTRTMVKCLHRFCRECIDKSMRLVRNECPACRAHCASRRSLRDDPNFDALISSVFPDRTKLDREDHSLAADEAKRNKEIQRAIAQTEKRQTEVHRKLRSAGLPEPGGPPSSAQSLKATPSRHRRGDSADAPEEDAGPSKGMLTRRGARKLDLEKHESSPPSSPVLDLTGEVEGSQGVRGKVSINASLAELLSTRADPGPSTAAAVGEHTGGQENSFKAEAMQKPSKALVETDGQEEVGVHLSLQPKAGSQLPALERPYLCCSGAVTVAHIFQLLRARLYLPLEAPIHIMVSSEGWKPLSACLPAGLLPAVESERKHKGKEARCTKEDNVASGLGLTSASGESVRLPESWTLEDVLLRCRRSSADLALLYC